MHRITYGKAFDIGIKREWLRVSLFSLVGYIVGGIPGAFLSAAAVIAVICFTYVNLYILCSNNFGIRQCGELVRKSKNFCQNCGNRVPDNLKSIGSSGGGTGSDSNS